MVKDRIYLDHNATAPLRPEARAAMMAVLDQPTNASSIHGEGRLAKSAVETARSQVAALVGGVAENVIFTSGATEAAMMALTPDIRLHDKPRRSERLLVAAVEHDCVLVGGRFAETHVLPVDENGLVDLSALRAALADGPATVAIQAVNSETGVIQPIAEIGQMVRTMGGVFVCDAVQAAGRIALDIAAMNIDMLILSAHKIGGPQGAGALVLGNATLEPAPLMTGGAQESRRRAGTENVAAIAGFGVAAELAKSEIDTPRPDVETGLRNIARKHGLSLHVFGSDAPGVPNTTCFALEGLTAQTALIDFDLRGIAISSGSACSSGKVERSHVLAAMDVAEDIAACALRVSTGPTTSAADIDIFLAAFDRIAAKAAARHITVKETAA